MVNIGSVREVKEEGLERPFPVLLWSVKTWCEVFRVHALIMSEGFERTLNFAYNFR